MCRFHRLLGVILVGALAGWSAVSQAEVPFAGSASISPTASYTTDDWAVNDCVVWTATELADRVALAKKGSKEFYKGYPYCKGAGGRPFIAIGGEITLNDTIVLSGKNGIHLVGGVDWLSTKQQLDFSYTSSTALGDCNGVAICITGDNHIVERLNLTFEGTGVRVSGIKNTLFRNTIRGYGQELKVTNTSNTFEGNTISQQGDGTFAVTFPTATTKVTAETFFTCNLVDTTDGGAASNVQNAGSPCDPAFLQNPLAQCLAFYQKCYADALATEKFTLPDADGDGIADFQDAEPETSTTASGSTDATDPLAQQHCKDGVCCDAGWVPFDGVCYEDKDADGDDVIDDFDTCPDDPEDTCATQDKGVDAGGGDGNGNGSGDGDGESADGGGGCSLVTDRELPGGVYGLLILLVVTAALAITRQFRKGE